MKKKVLGYFHLMSSENVNDVFLQYGLDNLYKTEKEALVGAEKDKKDGLYNKRAKIKIAKVEITVS